MSARPNLPTDGPRKARTMTALIERLDKMFDGHDLALVFGTLTSFITLALDNADIPLDVFIEALRGSERTHLAVQGGRQPDAKSETWVLLSADDRRVLHDAWKCMHHHCSRVDPGHVEARNLVAKLAGVTDG
jgi:hypothetical protein